MDPKELECMERMELCANRQLLSIETKLKTCMEQVNSGKRINRYKFDVLTDIMASHIRMIKTIQGSLEFGGRPQNTMKLHELTLELENLIEIGNQKIAEQNN